MMSGIDFEKPAKRRRDNTEPELTSSPKRSKLNAFQEEDRKLSREEIAKLGDEIPTSPKHFNSIATLLKYAPRYTPRGHDSVAALCKAFCVLIVDGRFALAKNAEGNELKVAQWLKARRDDYDRLLWDRLTSENSHLERQALSVILSLVQAELAAEKQDWLECWTGNRYFKKLVSSIAKGDVSTQVAKAFSQEYVNKYDDVRYFTFVVLAQVLRSSETQTKGSNISSSLITLVEALEPPQSGTKLDSHYHEYSQNQRKARRPPSKLSNFQNQAQKAFSKILTLDLGTAQRMSLLRLLTPVIVPWLQTPTHVFDFLTDSFEAGGSVSLLALSGMYEMMTEYNLDYPSFYAKLYSLLDESLLHSAHRSRFFRLLDKFLSSSHLPAAMVASFIKRLSRLAIHGPPAGVVAIVPWVYNMLKMHPTTTFMIHREPRTDEERQWIAEDGTDEPFDMAETDPMATGAIDSCLWEMETLQTHFHPNVASLAKIISQEFRKQSYSLDDFLDHSYTSLIAGDLGKEMKKAPVVEFEIPRQIFTTPDGDGTLADIMTDIMAQA